MPFSFKTPGVYLAEKSNSGNSIVQVSTAVPVFIGYTSKASINGKSLNMQPIQIQSMSDYETFFGGGPKPIFTLEEQTNEADFDVILNKKKYVLTQNENSRFYLYNSLKLFFDNGGADCYIISIGQYDENPDELEITPDKFKEAINLLEGEEIPTMLLMPDALLLNEEDSSYYSVLTYGLMHCGKHMNKVALFDIYNPGLNLPKNEKNHFLKRFRENIGTDYLSYGACYYPWLRTSIITKNDINYTNFNLESLKPIIEKKYESVLDNIIKSESEKEKKYWDAGLNNSENYQTLKKIIANRLCILPAAPAIAGLYTRVDRTNGVWIAPANRNLNSVIEPTVNICDKEQEDLNVNADTGKSINAIRTFRGRGSAIVWGVRTLDGNSTEWKYINVRRLFILIEQSIKNAAFSVVFQPNDSMTWSIVTATINNFLTNLWRQGALVGNSPSEAFSVACGLGTTMDQNDINEGIMRIQVMAAPSRPAEFIVISFEQKMDEK